MKYTLIGAHHPLAYSITLSLVQQGHRVTLFFQDSPPLPFFSLSLDPLKAYANLIDLFVGQPHVPLSLLPALEGTETIIMCLPDPYWDQESHKLSPPLDSQGTSRASSDFDYLYTQESPSLLNQGFQESMGHLLRSLSSRSTRSTLVADHSFLSSSFPSSSSFLASTSSWTHTLCLCLSQLETPPALFYVSNHQSLWHPQLETVLGQSLKESSNTAPSHSETFIPVWIETLPSFEEIHRIHQEYIDFWTLSDQLKEYTATLPRLFFYALPFGSIQNSPLHPPLNAVDLWIKHSLSRSTSAKVNLTPSSPFPSLLFPSSASNHVLSLIDISLLVRTCVECFLTFSFQVSSQHQEHSFFFLNQYQIHFRQRTYGNPFRTS